MTRPDHFAKSSWMLTLASLAMVIGALYLAKGLLVPLTLAALLSFLLIPMCDRLERRGLRRIPAVLLTAILGFSMLGILGWVAAAQMAVLAPMVPQYQSNIQAKIRSANDYVSGALSRARRTAHEFGQDLAHPEGVDGVEQGAQRTYPVRVISSPASPLEVFGGAFGTMVGVLGSTGIVIVLVVFFMVRREDLRDRFIHLVGKGQVTVTTQALEDATTRVSRYLSLQLLINVAYGVPVAVGLYLIGVPNAILWGMMATTLRFIPYVGPWIAAAAPIALSMAVTSGWVTPLLTLGLFLILELFSNNVMEPWLYGQRTGVSAVAVLVAAVFWTWLWGTPGLLLATPLTVCLLVIGKHVPQLSFLAILLGDEPVFEPKKRVYQRLLAGDQEEAAELIEDFHEQMPLVEVYDTVLVPALALTEVHWHRGELDEARHKFIIESLRASIEELGERQQATKAKARAAETKEVGGDAGLAPSTHSAKPCILCLPAHDEADEIAGMMLVQLLEADACRVHAVSFTTLVGEMANLVEAHQADVVCISSTPPAAVMQARYLCKRLRGRFPELTLVVGLWNAKGDLNKASERIGGGPAAYVVGTLADAQCRIRQLVQSLSLKRESQAWLNAAPRVMAEACA